MKKTESVWDYPRPPIVEPYAGEIRVVLGDETVALTRRAFRVLETSHPPTYYLPPEDVRRDCLLPAQGHTVCEWKGRAVYWALARAPELPVAWSYPRPRPRFDKIRNHLAFYPGRVECYVDSERVQAQAGGFYGGWITGEIVGPFKGEPGSSGW